MTCEVKVASISTCGLKFEGCLWSVTCAMFLPLTLFWYDARNDRNVDSVTSVSGVARYQLRYWSVHRLLYLDAFIAEKEQRRYNLEC